MFKPYLFEQKIIGWAQQRKNAFAFFGNRNFTQEKFRLAFPQYEFRLLKQVHGDTVVEASHEIKIADAHFTSDKNCALVVQTADCQPILFASENKVAACHAGWRGVAQKIPLKTAEIMADSFWVSIGPHLQFKNFEVHMDVAEKILSSLPDKTLASQFIKKHPDPLKTYINLAEISLQQIRSIVKESPHADQLPIDTIEEPSLHSFRRQGGKAERQFSFIVRL